MGKTTLQWLAKLGTGGIAAVLGAIYVWLKGPEIAAGPATDPVLGPALGGVLAFVAAFISNWLTNKFGPKPAVE